MLKEKDLVESSIRELADSSSGEESQILGFKAKLVNNIKERIAIANTIDSEQLGGLELEDRKSEAHQLFKWAIVVFYKEPVSKYYWGNFAVRPHSLRSRSSWTATTRAATSGSVSARSARPSSGRRRGWPPRTSSKPGRSTSTTRSSQ